MKIFIGSAREQLDLVREVQSWIEEAQSEPIPWDKPGLFLPGDSTFLRLIEISRSVDAAIFIFGEDDKVWYRGDAAHQPRDNVLIEYGIFSAALGPRKAIVCKNGEVRDPVDLLGITYIDLSPSRRNRGRVEFNQWVRRVDQAPSDPAIIQLHGKIAQLRNEREELVEKLNYEQSKSEQLIKMVKAGNSIDILNLETGKYWKLLFEYRFYRDVTNKICAAISSAREWKEELDNIGLKTNIHWNYTQGSDFLLVRKTLNYIRLFETPEDVDNYFGRMSPNFVRHFDECAVAFLNCKNV